MGTIGRQNYCWAMVSVTQLEGWRVVEAENAIALGQLMHAWTDLALDHITPILSEEDVLKLVA